jgi:predicted Zn-dependent protease with MMP-like domain
LTAAGIALSSQWTMDRTAFEALVAEALDGIPEEFGRYLQNVAVLIEEEPSPELLRSLGLDPTRDNLYGLYQGSPLPGRPYDYAALPDRITIFAGPLTRDHPSPGSLRRQVQTTIVHEIAHFFGLEERHIRRLGF